MSTKEFRMEWPTGLGMADMVGIGSTGFVARLNAVTKWVKPCDQEFIEREKRIYERIGNHPGVLRYYGPMGKGIVLQYVPHGSIRQYLQNHHHTTLALRIRWIIQITKTISFLHSKAVLHGDISGNNVFLDEDLNARIADFGGSSIDGEECLNGYETRYDYGKGAISSQSEIFALASTYFEILTGSRPYQDLDDDAVQHAYVTGVFPDVSSLKACGRVIQNCWNQKYTNINDLLDDLQTDSTVQDILRPKHNLLVYYLPIFLPAAMLSAWSWFKFRRS